jgi:hypothetical protein
MALHDLTAQFSPRSIKFAVYDDALHLLTVVFEDASGVGGWKANFAKGAFADVNKPPDVKVHDTYHTQIETQFAGAAWAHGKGHGWSMKHHVHADVPAFGADEFPKILVDHKYTDMRRALALKNVFPHK